MRILVGCEESQAVTIELRKLGHEAFSCDLLPCSGGHHEWHIEGDVLPYLNGNCDFYTRDKHGRPIYHRLNGKWDIIIAFPPCTDLAVSGARWFPEKIKDGRQQKSIDFFIMFANAKCDKIAIENPIGIMSSKYRKPDQIIQPWQFGHGETKATCLWLKGLPKLKPTNIVDGREQNIWLMKDERGKKLGWNTPEIKKARSKTYPGIAKAMAEQFTKKI